VADRSGLGISRELSAVDQAHSESDPDRRARITVAIVAAGFLVAVVAIVLVAGGSGSEERVAAFPAPKECLEAWNSDEEAESFARHNRISHNYTEAEVGYLSQATAEISGDPGAGDCAVAFARNSIDPEIVAAGQALIDGRWVPLSEVMDPNSVAELQSRAFDGANAEPTVEGDLAPIS
jgi:hypothetical protein